MGRPRGRPLSPQKTGSEEVVDDKQLAKINLYDGNAVKHALDEGVREIILRSGYKEDVFVSNVKILLGFIAIGLAVLSQFGPGKFPGNWWMVFGCVVGYIVCTTVLNVFCYFVEQDCFIITHIKKAIGVGLRAASKLDRYKDEYNLTVRSTGKDLREVKLTESYCKYFHEDGYLSEAALSAAVEKLVNDFELLVAPEKKTQ